ncbi:MAG: sigma-70 family RNA polymerase sigma factor [Myxococcota bacterium]
MADAETEPESMANDGRTARPAAMHCMGIDDAVTGEHLPNRKAMDAGALFRAHASFVARFLWRLGVPAGDVDDCVQRVFLVAHRRGGYVPGAAQPRTWLAEIAARVASTANRGRRRRREHASDALDAAAAGPRTDPERAFETRRAVDRVRRALGALAPEQRAVFVLYELEGEPCTAIATALGVPQNTVYSRLHRARRRFLEAHERLGDERERTRKGAALTGGEPVRLLDDSGVSEQVRRHLETMVGAPGPAFDVEAGLERLETALESGNAPTAGEGVSAGLRLGWWVGSSAAVGAVVVGAWLAFGSQPSGDAPSHARGSGAASATASPFNDSSAIGATETAPGRTGTSPEPTSDSATGPAREPTAAEGVADRGGVHTDAREQAEGRGPQGSSAGRTHKRRPDERVGPRRSRPAVPSAAGRSERDADGKAGGSEPGPDGAAAGDSPERGGGADVFAEIRAIATARRLVRSAPERALDETRRAARRFPDGQLVQERRALTIEALARLGRMAAARRAFRSFASDYPDSSFTPELRRRVRSRATEAEDGDTQ